MNSRRLGQLKFAEKLHEAPATQPLIESVLPSFGCCPIAGFYLN
jgi:hypothetical protein